MIEQLISYETAKLAKEKGFGWETDQAWRVWYDDAIEYFAGFQNWNDSEWSGPNEDFYSRPPQSVLQKWLRDHYVFLTVHHEFIGSDEWVFAYRIDYLPKEYYEAKRRCVHFVCKESYRESPGGTYWGGWDSYEEALENGLLEALKLI